MGYRRDVYLVIYQNDERDFCHDCDRKFFYNRERLSGGRVLFSRLDTKSSIWDCNGLEVWSEDHPCQVASQGEMRGDAWERTEGDIKPHFEIQATPVLVSCE